VPRVRPRAGGGSASSGFLQCCPTLPAQWSACAAMGWLTALVFWGTAVPHTLETWSLRTRRGSIRSPRLCGTRSARPIFFMRCGRARALHSSTMAVMSNPGQRIGCLKSYSRPRWAGEAVTISAAQEYLPALQHTLLSNAHSDNPFPVPESVTAALEPTSRHSIHQSAPSLKVLAAAVALLEADAAPLSSYAGLFATLRSALDTFFLELPLAARVGLQSSLSARFAAFSDPMVALAFYLDEFWGPARGRVAGLLWTARAGEEGQSLPDLRDAAITSLADGDAPLAARLQSELSEFLAFAAQPARAEVWTRLHPLAWWRLHGERFTLWYPICLRLFVILHRRLAGNGRLSASTMCLPPGATVCPQTWWTISLALPSMQHNFGVRTQLLFFRVLPPS